MSLIAQIRLVWFILVTVLFAYYVLRDAQNRRKLLFDAPPWAWALLVLGTSILGVVFYWLANCARFVRDQTLVADHERTEGDEQSQS